MIKKIATMLMLSLLPLIAQEDFLAGVKAEDLMLDRIEAPGAEDTIGISNWGKFFFNIANVQTSPDNKMRIVVMDDGIWVIDTENRVRKHIDDRGCMPQWSIDASRIAFIKRRILEGQYHKGHQLYGGSDLWICEPDGENKTNLMPGVDIGEFQWSPDGKHIAFTYRDEERGKWALGIVNVEIGEKTFLDEGSPYDFTGFSFSPNGQLIAYCKPLKWKLEGDWINTDAEIYVINIDGSGRTQITETIAIEKMVKWSLDGRRLIVRQMTDPEYVAMEYVIIVLKKEK